MAEHFEDRFWQLDALAAWVHADKPDFLAEAAPSAGKTRFAQLVARYAIERRGIRRIIIVVPTASLREQIATAFFDQAGIALTPDYVATDNEPGEPFVGVVVTYQAVAQSPLTFRRLAATQPTLVVFDEIHHAGDELAWGKAIRTAFEVARYRLGLSGTPFRSDSERIPFVTYVDGKSKPDSRYGYQAALEDGVVSSVTFSTGDGDFEWLGRHGNMRATFKDELSEDEARERLRAALDIRGQWLPITLKRADARISEMRAGGEELEPDPDACGLVVCKDIDHAEAVAVFLEKETGERPALVTSDQPDAGHIINAFKKSTQRWLVSVRMVSEGVDIPRLRVGVFATVIVTEMFFRQFVGRFTRGADEAVIFLPADKYLLDYAARIMEERDHALIERARKIVEGTTPSQSSLFQFLGSTYEEYVTIRGGFELPAALMVEARRLVEAKATGATEYFATLLAQIMHEQGWPTAHVTGGATTSAPGERGRQQAPHIEKRNLTPIRVDSVNTFTRMLCEATGQDPKNGLMRKAVSKAVNGRLIRIYGVGARQASPDTMRRQIRQLSAWIAALSRATQSGEGASWARQWEEGLYDDDLSAAV